MEIVHLVRQYKPSIGGLEDVVFNLCSSLARRPGTRVRIVTVDRLFTHPGLRLPRHEVLDGLEVTRIPCFGSSRYAFAFSVLNEIKSADIVHVHGVSFFFDFLSWTRWWHRKILVASTHGGFFHTTFAARLKRLYFSTVTRFSCLGYKALCASSENDAATFAALAPGKVTTIENGVNIEKWRDCASRSPQRAMIYIGRWSVNKSIPTLIAVVAALKDLGHDWRLIIAGIPFDETNEGLRREAERLGVSDRVSIHEGASVEEIGRLIGQCSYIASASAYEGFGLSLIEGLSAGLVPIASAIPPFEKLRHALGFGAVIDKTDMKGVAAEIETLHARVCRAPDEFRQKAMTLADRYGWERVTDQFVAIYQSVVAKRKI